MLLKWQGSTSHVNIVYFRKMFSCSDFLQNSNVFSTQENPSRMLALTSNIHSPRLPTFLPLNYQNYCKIFFLFCILRPLKTIKFISPVGYQYLTMQVILSLQKLCKTLGRDFGLCLAVAQASVFLTLSVLMHYSLPRQW